MIIMPLKYLMVCLQLLKLVSSEGCVGINGLKCQFPYVLPGDNRTYFECSTEAPGGRRDLFGRCPTRLVAGSREASSDPADWAKCDRVTCPLQQYTQNADIQGHMLQLSELYPDLAQFVLVGQSSLGQNITGLRISRNVRQERQLLKPMVRYVGNMHGNEPVGREMLNHFASVLLQGYGIDVETTRLLDTTDITIIPTMNPDGFDRGKEGACSGADYKTGRYNEGNVDLNRNFPTWADVNMTREQLFEGREPETQAMMKLILEHPWVMSANFHDGAVVASYPYDDYGGRRQQTGLSVTPDHDFFQHLARTYANNHQTMRDPSVCTRWYFQDGITNGADWYPLYGGMQDFNYLYTNDFEITLELSCCKYPRRYYLNKEWERNRDSMLEYLQQVHRGVKGMVTTTLEGASVGGSEGSPAPLSNAVIIVSDEDRGVQLGKNVTSSSRGEYWRLLMPGNYSVRAFMDMCSSAGIVLTSDRVGVTITEQQPLVTLDLNLNDVIKCDDNNGPR